MRKTGLRILMMVSHVPSSVLFCQQGVGAFCCSLSYYLFSLWTNEGLCSSHTLIAF